MRIVVGSGPAGAACASALLARGCDVLMLDGGITLEPQRREILERLSGKWDAKLVESLKHRLTAKNPIKLAYGSDYPYAEAQNRLRLRQAPGVQCMPSLAEGGLSNVWGAFAEPYAGADVKGWPITAAELAKYYGIVFSMISRAVSECAPEQAEQRYRSSAQAKALLEHWRLHGEEFRTAGMSFGSAALAARFNECIYCGLCQHGCPLDLIYSARHTLQALKRNPRFQYRGNAFVQEIREDANGVTALGEDRITGEAFGIRAEQAFLACGPVASTALAARAMGAFGEEIAFLDSTHFLLPCVMPKRIRGASGEALHTLAQLYLKLEDAGVAPHPVNLQLYTFMDHYADRLRRRMGFAYAPLLERLLAIQGHLHSADSHGFRMRIDGAGEEIRLLAEKNSETPVIVRRAAAKLWRRRKLLGFFPIIPMLSISSIGKSFHYGGSLPMRLSPTRFSTDRWGRLSSSRRFHVVDASILPSIPAGSITPAIMANAYRIGQECPL